MAQSNLEKAVPAVAVADIELFGDKLMIPEGMAIDQAIDLLMRRKDYEEEACNIEYTLDVLPFDGAHALGEVLTKLYGWSAAISQKSMFGKRPPVLITIDVSPTEKTQVVWGAFSIPTIKDGVLKCDVEHNNHRFQFKISAKVLHKDEAEVRKIFAAVDDYIKNGGSIYQGKAIKIRFMDDDGEEFGMPEVGFIDVSKASVDKLIYSEEIQQAVETNLFTPITRVHDCIQNNIPVKRGVLLGGPYGTGKTLAATVAAKLATDNGVTYIYVPRANELSHAIEFAKQYQSPASVVFCEDVDRVVSGERSVSMDDILNILDGIDTKNANIITVLTTNHLEKINPAMLRPGRLDAVLKIMPPDSVACEKLVRLYASGLIAENEDLSEVGKILDGNIPATIEEVVKRAKLSQLRLQAPGTKVESLTALALLDSAETMVSQVTLMREASQKKEVKLSVDAAMYGIYSNAFADLMKPLLDRLSRIERAI